MTNPEQKRRERGEASECDLYKYGDLNEDLLFPLLNSSDPVQRTCAAKLLGNYKSDKTTAALCDRLLIEDKLYCRLAIADSLIILKEKSLPLLLDLLGRIGNNQEKTLPTKGFLKKSYPLPRDMAARILSRFGKGILERIFKYMESTESLTALEQALDVIGHISFRNGIKAPYDTLIQIYEKHRTDMVRLKIIRCLSCGSDDKGRKFLEEALESGITGFELEASRSLTLSGVKIPETVMKKLDPGVRSFIADLERII